MAAPKLAYVRIGGCRGRFIEDLVMQGRGDPRTEVGCGPNRHRDGQKRCINGQMRQKGARGKVCGWAKQVDSRGW